MSSVSEMCRGFYYIDDCLAAQEAADRQSDIATTYQYGLIAIVTGIGLLTFCYIAYMQLRSPLNRFLDMRLAQVKPDAHLTPKLLQRMVVDPALNDNPRLGLRHISSSAAQQREAREGIPFPGGDSLNLCFYFGSPREVSEGLKFYTHPNDMNFFEEWRMCRRYEESLGKFIEASYYWDLDDRSIILLGSTKVGDALTVLDRTRFSIVCYSNMMSPCDFASYQGLGKMGKQLISAEAIVPLPAVTAETLGLGDIERDYVIRTSREADKLYQLMVLHTLKGIFQFQPPSSPDSMD
jgi:hypothetical protein